MVSGKWWYESTWRILAGNYTSRRPQTMPVREDLNAVVVGRFVVGTGKMELRADPR